MILTVTPNPSLDLLFRADRLLWDDANRVDAPRRRAGGQGINLVRAARVLGGAAEAIALLGGETGSRLQMLLESEGTPVHPVAIAGETRLFVGVAETAGRNLLLNPRGPQVADAEVAALQEVVRKRVDAARWLVCCGSLPPGAPPATYARLKEVAAAAGARFVVDCDGEALRLAAAGADLLVPNRHEAERLLGMCAGEIDSLDAALRAAAALGARFEVPIVAVTLGAEGAVLVHGEERLVARAPRVEGAGSAVGAGDAFLAGLLLGLDAGLPTAQALGRAVAAGSAVLLSTGSAILDEADAASLLPLASVHPA